ncbi:hypothetical protein GYMLUDRAFT_208922 [Collybiopsis luxurians FD-317 M1]|uniref:Uncharacterized protein n=1 Tax=Collybiopsis luxurians FD-317 M1 TaxID=944289 RepID=A0A0D0C0A7_9AGAR|nr:hypothetical protein GYMLUDRAFT_208922 [Collybiopsis luxurians FD-317 M1]
MAENIAVASAQDDELDFLSDSSMLSVVHSVSAPVQKVHFPEESGRRRSLRAKTSSSLVLQTSTTQKAPRKRPSSSVGTAEISRKKAKKSEDKKANTAAHSSRKVNRDARRTAWLLKHRHLFEPLLPSSGNFFTSLKADAQARSFAPLREIEQPKLVMGQMKDYQITGLSFLAHMFNNGMNAILGDEMGLGKTLQTLSLFAYIAEKNPGDRLDPHLIICPLSVLSSWEAEAARWLPSMTTVRFHGSENERNRLHNTLRESHFDILITTYESYALDDSWFKSRHWTYCVLDEGHKIKNSETIVAQKLQGLNAIYRLILTGTPIQNNLTELWSLLHYLYPFIFTPKTAQLFRSSFDLTKGSYSLPFLTAAQKLLQVVMIRRTKANVAFDVPPRVEQTIFIPLTEMQRFWYMRMITRMDSVDFREIFDEKVKLEDGSVQSGRNELLSLLEEEEKDAEKGKNVNQWKKLMNLLLQLRRICDHPYTLKQVEPDPYYLGEHVVTASSKLIAIDKILADILPKGEKVLIFSQWTSMLDVLEDMMSLRNIKYARLDGSTPRPRRALDIKLFQHEKSVIQVYLIATKAGGLGINLTKATTVIMADSDWNPQNDIQAIARAHRIGQTKTVKVYRLICAGSVEDQMLDRLRRKLFLSLKIMGSDNPDSTSNSTGMSSSALLDILRKGSSALLPGDDMDLEKFIRAPIQEILEMSKAREDARDEKIAQSLEVRDDADGHAQQLLANAEEEERRLLSGVAQVSCRLFEGRMLERSGDKSNAQIAEEWTNMKKRVSKGKETIVIGGMTFIVDPDPDTEMDKAGGKDADKLTLSAAGTKKVKMGSEEWCHVCEDGGELYLCARCPRVFHASCRGLTRGQAQNASSVFCSQHTCCDCSRGAGDAGGMLFRCRTCYRAFCEDCLPEPFDPIGESIPEFTLLNYRETPSAYFINCAHCLEKAEADSHWKAEWDKTFRHAEWTLKQRYTDADLNI